MEATTTQPTLLSAARNFIRKSAGTAVLTIAPLAAVSLAPEAEAQTIFAQPGLNIQASGQAQITASFPEGNRFSFQGATNNNIQAIRFGVDGTLTTSVTSGFGFSVDHTLEILSAITNLDIPGSTIIPVAYDFTLSKQAGTIGNVDWYLKAHVTGDNFVNLASGTLTSGSATFTGSGNYNTLGLVSSAGGANNFSVLLELVYTTTVGDVLFIGMNSASQGMTLNAVPEPSTYAVLLGLGALGFVLVRRSRRSRAA